MLDRDAHDLADRPSWVERVVGTLEDVLDAAAHLFRPLPGPRLENLPIETDLAGPRVVEANDGAGERRLPRSGLTYQGDALFGSQVERDAVQDLLGSEEG